MTLRLRQLMDASSSTLTYLIYEEDSRAAIIIDPVYEQFPRDFALIEELGLRLEWVLDTHCHADHVTAAWLFSQKTKAKYAVSESFAAEGADRLLLDGDCVEFGSSGELKVLGTPGHTEGCLSYYCPTLEAVFTGDALLIRGTGRTDFQSGSPSRLYQSIHEVIFALDDQTKIYPAHDYHGRFESSVGEEKRLNPRIGGGANKRDFVRYLENLGLPHPKKIAVAVPANLKGGKPENGKFPFDEDWAPLFTSYAGIQEISHEWLIPNLEKVYVLDVRDADEIKAQPVLDRSIQIPLAELKDRLDEIASDKPIVAACRSGRRSAAAVNILKKNGFSRVANLQQGFLEWPE